MQRAFNTAGGRGRAQHELRTLGLLLNPRPGRWEALARVRRL
jgi:hypothetical protein